MCLNKIYFIFFPNGTLIFFQHSLCNLIKNFGYQNNVLEGRERESLVT
jgi:hypothetical protein